MGTVGRPLPVLPTEGLRPPLTRDDWLATMRVFVQGLSHEELADLAALVWIERTRPGRVLNGSREVQS